MFSLFRFYRDLAGLEGFDFAYSTGGYYYHTAMDQLQNIQEGSIQHYGVRLNLVQNLYTQLGLRLLPEHSVSVGIRITKKTSRTDDNDRTTNPRIEKASTGNARWIFWYFGTLHAYYSIAGFALWIYGHNCYSMHFCVSVEPVFLFEEPPNRSPSEAFVYVWCLSWR